MESFHQFGNRVTRSTPLGLIAEDYGVRPKSGELSHGRDDEIVLELALSAAVDGPGHEVASNQIERRHPATDPDSSTFPEALEVVVVTDRDSVMLGNVAGKVDPLGRRELARESAVVIGRAVADRAGRQFHVGRRLRSERKPASPTERAGGGPCGRATRKAGDLAGHWHLGTDAGRRSIPRSSFATGCGTIPRAAPSGGTLVAGQPIA